MPVTMSPMRLCAPMPKARVPMPAAASMEFIAPARPSSPMDTAMAIK